MVGQLPKTTLQIYRDCMRLIKHVAGNSSKATMVRGLVRREFAKNRGETDEQRIAQLKANAVRGLANYFMMESASRDARFQASAANFSKREAGTLNVSSNSTPTTGRGTGAPSS